MVELFHANDGVHKYVAVFDNDQHIAFGNINYEDYTLHKDKERKRLYILRHRKREDWTNPRSAGALSRWILWNKPTLEASFKDYIKRFHMHM
jgi:hypothetical protein